jgi:hypothetical protein
MVTARFRISRVTPMGADNMDDAYAAEVEMTPDYAGGANHQWSQATPSGMMRLTITNKDALAQLPHGKSVEIGITVLD